MTNYPHRFFDARARRRLVAHAALLLAGLGFIGGPLARSTAAQAPEPIGFKALDPTNASRDARLAVDFRPAVLVRNLWMRAVLTQLPPDTSSEIRALASGIIEQILVLVGDGPPPDPGHRPSFRVSVLVRANRASHWGAFPSGRWTNQTQGAISYRRSEERPLGFRVLDDRTLLIASEADIARPLLGPGVPAGPHPWDNAWRRLGPGTLRLALDAAWLREQTRELREAIPPEAVRPVAPLIDQPLAYTLSISDREHPGLNFVALCPDEAAAGAVTASIRLLLEQARAALPGLRRDLGSLTATVQNPQSALPLALYNRTVTSARVERVGTEAQLTAEVEVARPAALGTAHLIATIPAARAAARRAQSVNNLKQIGLALHNYESQHGELPPAVVLGPDGKTPHSWRVEILPYLDGGADLLGAYKLDEPWNSPSNLRLVARMPEVFHAPAHTDAAPGVASYFAPVGPATAFPPGRARGLKFREIQDGLSTTILAVEARRATLWTQPEDLPVDLNQPGPPLGERPSREVLALMADGSVLILRRSIEPKTLKALLTPNGAEVVERDDF